MALNSHPAWNDTGIVVGGRTKTEYGPWEGSTGAWMENAAIRS